MLKNLSYFIQLLRVKQWVKNVFILFPLIFSGKLNDFSRLSDCVITFLGFCLMASGTYILNDFLDSKRDRLHPKKSKRPLAEGKFNAPSVILLMFILMALGLWLCLLADAVILYIAVIYILLHVVYNYGTKTIVILDVIFVAVGFQIRIWAGSFAADVLPSVWLQMCVFLLALFLGFTKRRYEISTLRDKAAEHRSVLAHYTSYLLDQIIIICSTLTVVFYGLYAISSDIVERIGNHNMVYSLVFVIYGIFRYLYLVHVKKLGDDPGDVIFSDIPTMINMALWIFYIIVVLYPSLRL